MTWGVRDGNMGMVWAWGVGMGVGWAVVWGVCMGSREGRAFLGARVGYHT